MQPHPATRVIALIGRSQAGRDGDGNTKWAETATRVTGLFAPGGSSEATDGQDRVVTQPQVILGAGEQVPSLVDAVVPDPVLDDDGQLVLDGAGKVQGRRYEVDGDPEAWEPGTVVRLKGVSG